tara:strand:+ start:82 stop:285 length:204 start_codon:yes stop_codon:yes gene_type:complete
MSEKKYKYLIIDTTSDEAIIKKSYREIADFINIVSKEQISHNTVCKRLTENNSFNFENLIITNIKLS